MQITFIYLRSSALYPRPWQVQLRTYVRSIIRNRYVPVYTCIRTYVQPHRVLRMHYTDQLTRSVSVHVRVMQRSTKSLQHLQGRDTRTVPTTEIKMFSPTHIRTYVRNTVQVSLKLMETQIIMCLIVMSISIKYFLIILKLRYKNESMYIHRERGT